MRNNVPIFLHQKGEAPGKSLLIQLLIKSLKRQSTWDLRFGDSSLKAKIERMFEVKINKPGYFSLSQMEVKHYWLTCITCIQTCMERNC